MKRLLMGLFCLLIIVGTVACKDTGQNDTPPIQENTETETSEPFAKSEDIVQEDTMILLINDNKVPVIWEDSASVKEIIKEASKDDIIISMSKYSDFEQVGSLGKSYTRNDKQMTTKCGDIVLYNGSNLVVFYRSNSWAYTSLGRIDLSNQEIIDLLSNKDVTITLKR